VPPPRSATWEKCFSKNKEFRAFAERGVLMGCTAGGHAGAWRATIVLPFGNGNRVSATTAVVHCPGLPVELEVWRTPC
jgi:hypothetical protein